MAREKKILTPHGREVLARIWKPLPWVVTVLVSAAALIGCAHVGTFDVGCVKGPDGVVTCSGEVNGM